MNTSITALRNAQRAIDDSGLVGVETMAFV
jgi:hypothetical protein